MSATTLRPRSAPPFSLPRAGNGALVVAATLATVAATAWAVMSAAWVDGTAAVLLTAVAGVLEAVLVARSSVGRVIAVLLLPVVGTLVVVPLTYGSMPGADSTTLGDAAQQYLSALATGLFVQGDWPFLVGLCGVFWLIGAWTGWLAVRERRGVLAVLPCYAVLAVNALNAPSLEHVAFPEAVAVALSLVVVGRVHLLDLSARWRRGGVVALPGTEQRFGRVTLGAALLLLVAALVVPPASTRDISGMFFKFNGSGGGHGNGSGNGGNAAGGGSPGTIRFDPNTVPGGPLISQPVNVLSYTTSSDQAFYMRVVDDSFFTEGNWFPTAPASINANLTATYVRSPAGPIRRDRNPGNGGVAAASSVQPVSARVVLTQAATGPGAELGIFPGEPDAINVDGSASGLAVSDGLGNLLTVDQFQVDTETSSFVSTGTVSTATVEQLRNAGTDYPSWVTQGFLDLNPSTQSDREQISYLQSLAKQWTVGWTNEYDEASAIERHLRDPNVFTYTLKPPQQHSGGWAITYFLQQSHKGYCQYFASAMGALLRAAGIPARLVSGYGPGSVDDASSRPGATLHTVSSSDAHVWVEAYFPHYGWIPFEPTPDGVYEPIARGSDSASTGTTPTPSPSSAATPTPKPRTTPRPGQGVAPVGSTGPTLPPALIAVVLSLAFLAVLLVLLRNWLARPRTLPAMWRRLHVFGAAMGVRRRPAETYAAYVRRLSHALPPDTTTLLHRQGDAEIGPRPVRARVVSALEQLAASSGKAEFSASGLNERERVQWHRSWDRVRRAMPLLLWRVLLSRRARRGESF